MNVEELVVKSNAFVEGGWIPKDYTGRGRDISPQLSFENVCEQGRSLVIALDDVSHPLFPNYNHWIVWNVPVVKELPEGLPAGKKIDVPVKMNQGIAYGRHKYRGPKPPFNTNHKYMFSVYVLDTELELEETATREVVYEHMAGHVLQKGTLSGWYQRWHKTEGEEKNVI